MITHAHLYYNYLLFVCVFSYLPTKSHALVNNSSILPVTGLNTAAAMQTVPLHPPATHSQPATAYTDITATAGAGIITHS